MKFVTALVAGLLFGAGLLVSGMADPANVLGFLDIAGAWNPALAFTMGGALAVAAPAYAWVRRHGQIGGSPAQLPSRRTIDTPLLLGSGVFGVGWGMSGICPGPGLLLLTSGAWPAVVFVAAMLAGMVLGIRAAGRWPTRDKTPVAAEP